MRLVPFLSLLFLCLTFAFFFSLLESFSCDSLASKSDALPLCTIGMRY